MFLRFLIVLTTILVSNIYAAVGFSPGCNFVGGQCMYTVQLGHTGQCDAAASPSGGSDSSKCCDDIKQEVANMKSDINNLKSQVQKLLSSLNQATADLQSTQNNLNKTERERDALVIKLREIEIELNSTNKQLAQAVAQAGAEIKNLRAELTNATVNLSICRAALGVPTGEVLPSSTSDDVTLDYCNFKSVDACGYSSLSGNIKWKLMKKGSSDTTGPKSDHSFGSWNYGTYLAISGSEVAGQFEDHYSIKKASIESPMYEPANDYCIFFWYSMVGSDVETLDVNIRVHGGTGYPVWSRSGNQKNNWQMAQIELDSEHTSHPFNIDFVGKSSAYKTRISSYRVKYHKDKSDIGIDDVYVYNTSCSNIPRCPPGSHRNTLNNVTSCYTFHATPMTWYEAYDTCRQEGPWSALVSLETRDEHDFLTKLLKTDPSLSIVGQNGFYTSGSDIGKEHVFSWTHTGTPQNMTFSSWHSGQPNDVGGHQDCLLMEYPTDNFNWGDVECDTKHAFICEVSYNQNDQ